MEQQQTIRGFITLSVMIFLSVRQKGGALYRGGAAVLWAIKYIAADEYRLVPRLPSICRTSYAAPDRSRKFQIPERLAIWCTSTPSAIFVGRQRHRLTGKTMMEVTAVRVFSGNTCPP